jgi:hypothetical protein
MAWWFIKPADLGKELIDRRESVISKTKNGFGIDSPDIEKWRSRLHFMSRAWVCERVTWIDDTKRCDVEIKGEQKPNRRGRWHSLQKLFLQLRIEIWSGSDLFRRKMKEPRVIANASNFLFLYSLSLAFPLIRESDVSHLKGDQNILLLQLWKPLLERTTKYNFRC